MAEIYGFPSAPYVDFVFLHSPTYPEQRLWRAVILQALQDAACRSVKAERQADRKQAMAWILRGGEEFLLVCEFAGIAPHQVRTAALAIEPLTPYPRLLAKHPVCLDETAYPVTKNSQNPAIREAQKMLRSK